MADCIGFINGEWKFYKDERLVPIRARWATNLRNYAEGKLNKDGTGKEYDKFLHFPLKWYEQDHWAYGKKDGVWYVWRVQMKDGTEVNRKLIASDVGEYKPEAIRARIKDGMYKVSDEQKLHHSQSWVHKDIELKPVYWSQMFDGKHILALCAYKPKMSYAEIKMVLDNEGAEVDAQGIIHAAK